MFGENQEVLKKVPMVVCKLKHVVQKLSLTDGVKEGHSKFVASSGFL